MPHVDLLQIIQAIGLFGVIAVVFAESGLLIGFFLPGDSLLFTAGLLASQHYFNIVWLVIGSGVAAIVGDSVGYWIGTKIGPRIFTREDSFLFRRSYVERTKIFFDKHGPMAIILSRFIPIVRTFTPTLAGVGGMKYRTFLTYNIIGGALWGSGIPLLGFFLGRAVPDVDKYLLPIIAVIILTSFIPPIMEFFRHRNRPLEK